MRIYDSDALKRAAVLDWDTIFLIVPLPELTKGYSDGPTFVFKEQKQLFQFKIITRYKYLIYTWVICTPNLGDPPLFNFIYNFIYELVM